jgi:parallel beta-helix repeat protein
VRIANFVGGGGCHQDVEVIGDYAYVATFTWYGYGIRNLYILPLQSEYPYFDSSNVVTIPFNDFADTPVGSTCDTVPLLGDHTLFATNKYLYICEAGIHDDYQEIAILDVSSNPTAPILAGLIDSTDVEVGFDGAHSVCVVADTIYTSEFRRGLYKIVVDPTNNFNVESWGKILYSSLRRDVGNSDPWLGQYEDSLFVIDWHPDTGQYYDPCGPCDPLPCSCWVHNVKPGSHSNYVAPNGYLLSCDEGNTDHRWSNQQNNMACILRVFNTADFDTLLDTVTVHDAFDIIWKDTSPYLEYSVDVSEMDGATWPAETPMPDNWDCDTTLALCYSGMGIHDVTVVGRLGLVAYYQYGTHILDVSDPTDLEYRGGIAHSLAPNDDVDHDAYAVCMDDAGYIYQNGSSGLYIYRYGETGSITASDASFSNDVYIYDTLTVASGAKLTLNSGTHVYMFEDALLKIDGTLLINGTSSDSVKFFALGGEPGPGSWQGIYISSDAACTLSYCSILNADNGIEMRNDSEVKIANCNISNCNTSGIYNYKGYLTLIDSRIANNEVYGLYGYGSADTVKNTTFHMNKSYGIRLTGTTSSNDESYLIDNDITYTSGENNTQYGIYVKNNDYITIDQCTVEHHNQGGLKLENSDADVTECTFENIDNYGIYSLSGSFPTVRYCIFDTSDGNNSFLYCRDYFVHFSGFQGGVQFDSLFAQMNWWGSSTPNTRKFYHSPPNIVIVYSPNRTSAPKLSSDNPIPLEFTLHQNYPNPFNSNTILSFSLDQPAKTVITVYNILGQKVATPLSENLNAGNHSVIWDGRNSSGSPVASGVYFYTIRSGDHLDSKKMLLLR